MDGLARLADAEPRPWSDGIYDLWTQLETDIVNWQFSAALGDLDALRPATVDRVVEQEVRQHLLAREIVDVDELDVGAVPAGA